MLTDIKKNITSIFMVPTLRVNKDYLKESGFINGYVIDSGREDQYDGCVYMLFHPENIETFRDFLQNEYDRAKNIIEDYDYKDGFVVIVYQLDKKYDRDFKLIKEGKYSKTSTSFKEIFPKTIKMNRNGYFKEELTLQHRIFNKTSDLREYWENKIGIVLDEDIEVWSGWNDKNETLNIENLKEYV